MMENKLREVQVKDGLYIFFSLPIIILCTYNVFFFKFVCIIINDVEKKIICFFGIDPGQ